MNLKYGERRRCDGEWRRGEGGNLVESIEKGFGKGKSVRSVSVSVSVNEGIAEEQEQHPQHSSPS